MSLGCFRSSRPDAWSVPRPYSDPNLRLMKHGPIRPMEDEGGILWRLWRK
jgi:hypothetical protein